MLALAALVLVWLLVLRPLGDMLSAARERHGEAVAALAEARSQAAAIAMLERGGPASIEGPIDQAVAAAASEAGFQLSALQPQGPGRVSFALGAARPQALFGWIAGLEGAGLCRRAAEREQQSGPNALGPDRAPGARRLMRLRLRWWRELFFLGALLFALVALLPLRFAIDGLGFADRGLTARSAAGSLWLGALDEARFGPVPLGDVATRLRVLPLLAGRARLDVAQEGDGFRAGLTVSRHGFGIDDASGTIEVAGFGATAAGDARPRRRQHPLRRRPVRGGRRDGQGAARRRARRAAARRVRFQRRGALRRAGRASAAERASREPTGSTSGCSRTGATRSTPRSGPAGRPIRKRFEGSF